MTTTAIHVDRLSKRYRIGVAEPYHRFSEVLQGMGRNLVTLPSRAVRRSTVQSSPASPAAGEFWALKDVSFEVGQGEVVGIIGRNGAGKSTLLKILSRITEATSGRFGLRGRVASLLEVGTGFHPELTGRENIFLSGTILGMNRQEIKRNFDEIIAFAEIEDFLDTPVKRYSSGMYVRLGFAIAAHLQPEILIVDEVLAVGDAQFQKKCLGKMGSVAQSGRTVVFVSHNMAAVSALCERCVFLRDGSVEQIGPADDVVRRYLAQGQALSGQSLLDRTDRIGSGEIRFTGCRLVGRDRKPLEAGAPACFVLEYESAAGKPIRNLDIALTILDSHGHRLVTLATLFAGGPFDLLPPRGELVCETNALPLSSGVYTVQVWSAIAERVADFVEDAMQFEVEPYDFYGVGRMAAADKHGPLLLPHQWLSA